MRLRTPGELPVSGGCHEEEKEHGIRPAGAEVATFRMANMFDFMRVS